MLPDDALAPAVPVPCSAAPTAGAVILGALTANLCPPQWFRGPGRGAAHGPDTQDDSRQRHDLSRIHDVVGIERALDGRHGRQRGASQFAREIFHLSLPDPVLARTSAVHGERAL